MVFYNFASRVDKVLIVYYCFHDDSRVSLVIIYSLLEQNNSRVGQKLKVRCRETLKLCMMKNKDGELCHTRFVPKTVL